MGYSIVQLIQTTIKGDCCTKAFDCYDYDYDYDLIQGKGDVCKPAQYIVTLLLYS